MAKRGQPGDTVVIAITTEAPIIRTIVLSAKLEHVVQSRTRACVLVPGTYEALLEAIRASADIRTPVNQLYLQANARGPYLNEEDKGKPEREGYLLDILTEDAWTSFWELSHNRLNCQPPQLASHFTLWHRGKAIDTSSADAAPLAWSNVAKGIKDVAAVLTKLQQRFEATSSGTISALEGFTEVAKTSQERTASAEDAMTTALTKLQQRFDTMSSRTLNALEGLLVVAKGVQDRTARVEDAMTTIKNSVAQNKAGNEVIDSTDTDTKPCGSSDISTKTSIDDNPPGTPTPSVKNASEQEGDWVLETSSPASVASP